MERKVEIVTPIDVARDRGKPPVPAPDDAKYGRTVVVGSPEGGWTETYCCRKPDGSCGCGPEGQKETVLIFADDPDCAEKLRQLGQESAKILPYSFLKDNLNV